MTTTTTLNDTNQYRLDFLASYPFEKRLVLLRTNTPDALFNKSRTNELQFRRHGYFQSPVQYRRILSQDNESFFNRIYRTIYEDLGQRLHVDKALIDYNLTRLDEAMSRIEINRLQQYYTVEQLKTARDRLMHFDIEQYALALEIFLQFDVDLFYMKTCSYRHVQPATSTYEGLFCRQYEPRAIHSFQPCQRHEHCRTCSAGSLVRFSLQHEHRFRTGYRTILNCPAVRQDTMSLCPETNRFMVSRST